MAFISNPFLTEQHFYYQHYTEQYFQCKPFSNWLLIDQFNVNL